MGIGENIRRLRKEHEMSQSELARALGVTRAAVAQWEGGAFVPRIGKVQEMASVFRCDVSDIIGASNYSDFAAQRLDGDEERLLAAFRSLDHGQRKTVLAMVEGLSKQS